MTKPTAEKPEPKIAAATGTAGGAKTGLGRAVQAAMLAATEQAAADGVVDPTAILELKLAARERAKVEWRKKDMSADEALPEQGGAVLFVWGTVDDIAGERYSDPGVIEALDPDTNVADIRVTSDNRLEEQVPWQHGGEVLTRGYTVVPA
jgi:hypothetical protein